MAETLDSAPPRPTKSRRFAEFDSLRGVAAFTIMLDHWRRIYIARDEVPFFNPFHLLYIGHAFVLVFFALSGLVLSLPQASGKQVHFPSFVIKRIIRIYPAYLVAFLLAVAGCTLWHGSDFYGRFFRNTWTAAPDRHSVLNGVFLVGSYNFHRYSTSFWTLVHEMRISLFVPLLCLGVLASELGVVALAVALLAALAVVLEKRSSLPIDVVETVTYLAVFIIGSLCAKHLHTLNRRIAAVSRPLYWSAVLAVIAFMIAWPTLRYYLHLHAFAWEILLGLVAAAFILLSLRPDGLSPFLLHRAPLFIGKISYSIYLLHGSILWVFAYLFAGRFSPVAWFPAFLIVTILASWALYTAVELPSIYLGRSIESAMKRNWSPSPRKTRGTPAVSEANDSRQDSKPEPEALTS